MDSADTTQAETEVQRLAAQNQAISEELVQCQADKEFVWSLWKRLQVSKPDISQAISMVLQREKEKAEMKDRKILEILNTKDDKIAELEQLIAVQERTKKEHSERASAADVEEEVALVREQFQHEKETSEVRFSEYREKMEGLFDQKGKQLKEMENEKQALVQRCDRLQSEAEATQVDLRRITTLNSQYEGQIQELQRGLDEVTNKAMLLSQEIQSKTNSMVEARSSLQEVTSDLETSDQTLQSTRAAYRELKVQYDQVSHQASQQNKLIHQLQALQADTQKVLKDQQNAHNLELTSLQKTYAKLLEENEQLIEYRNELKQVHETERLRQESTKLPVRHVSLQVNLDAKKGERSRSKEMEVRRLREEIVSSTRFEMNYAEEASAGHNHETSSTDRATSTPVKQTARRARSLSPARSHELESGGGWGRDEMVSGASRHGRISAFLDESQRGGREARKKDDLRRLLKLKNQEVEELRKAHSRRLERLKTLQSSYDIMKEQIKTYEQHESRDKTKKRVERCDAKGLRREDSEGVWNELTHFKQQTAKLMQEKMNMEEEVDRLHVQTAVDSTTIEELTRCLDQERQSLESQLSRLQAANTREEREKSRAEELLKKNKKLQKSLQSLQDERSEWLEERSQMERQLRLIKADLVQAKTAETHHAFQHRALQDEVSKLKHKLNLHVLSQTSLDAQTMEQEPGTEEDHIREGDISSHSSSTDGGAALFHSTPRKRPARMSRSLTRSRERGSPTRSRARSVGRADESRRWARSRTGRSLSLSFGGLSPSRRHLVSVLHHLDRMAKAYQDTPPVFKSLLKSVATQTERVLLAESAMMTESDESSSVNTQSSEEASTCLDIEGISMIVSRKDTATSPMKIISDDQSSLPIGKKAVKSTGPSRASGNVALLKRRVGALQQQVSSLQDQRSMLQRAVGEQKEANGALKADLNLSVARHHNSKITIQRLTHELEESKRAGSVIEEQAREQVADKQSDAERKSAETRLKSQAAEIVRQGNTIKALKAEGEERNNTIKSLESKIEHLDRDINQKRSLIKDFRARAKSADAGDKIHAENVEMLEARIVSLTETLDQRKVEIDSLRKRVAVVTKEKHQHEKQSRDLQNALTKKTAVLKETSVKLSEAEKSLGELEETATRQLHVLASQSETALELAHVRIKQCQERVQELENFIQDLAVEISSRVGSFAPTPATSTTTTATDPPTPAAKDESLLRAQSIASSILNMDTSDLEQFMEVEEEERHARLASEQTKRKSQCKKWRKQIEDALAAKKLPKKRLKELILQEFNTKPGMQSLAREAR